MSYEPVLTALPQQEGNFDPCFAFSVHKCGSSLMHGMIDAVCTHAGIPGVSLPDVMFNKGIFEADWQTDPAVLPAFGKNIVYYGFRNLPPTFLAPQFRLRDRRFALLVRDPRDALVSQYFSYGKKSGSHARPENNAEAFDKMLDVPGEVPINRYALEKAPDLRNKFMAYRDNLNFDLGIVHRYEDVFFDKETFLREIFEHFGIAVPDQIIRDVAKAFDIRPEKEDDTKHIRKGTPGDHREKLDPETIGRLNDIFREVGSFYGYQL